MKKKFIMLASLGCFFLRTATAFTPIPISSGFNADVIANGVGPSSSSSSAFDIVNNWAFMSFDFKATATSPASNVGLPVSGMINSETIPGMEFQLGNYSGNNALLLSETNPTGSLGFSASGYGALVLLGCSANGPATASLTINFDDGTTQVVSELTFDDWFYALNPAISGIGRVNRDDDAIEGAFSDNPRIYQIGVLIDPANISKNITGISFTSNAINGATIAILGVTAVPICNGMPAGNTVIAPETACNGQYFQLSLGTSYGELGMTFDWQQSTDGTTWTSIADGNGEAEISTTQSGSSFYRCVITCEATAEQTITPSVEVQAGAFADCYCTQYHYFGCDDGSITSFHLIGEEGTAINTETNDCAFGYSDYMESVAPPTLLIGMNYNINLTFSGNENAEENGFVFPSIAVWIDFNDNDLYESNEKVAAEGAYSGGDLPIDLSNAIVGTHRMRVISVLNTFGDELFPCNTYFGGETEDYRVNITSEILPIALKSINAMNAGAVNHINWNTATEASGDYFELERSSDAKQFSRLANVTAKGTPSDYSYIDADPLPDINYYRLKLLGANSKATYSKVVSATVLNNRKVAVEVYPNPVKDFVTLKVYNSENGNVIVTDISGRTVAKAKVSGSTTQINMSTLAKGFYLIHYIDDNINKVVKVNKQ